jgi:hypothetical protein
MLNASEPDRALLALNDIIDDVAGLDQKPIETTVWTLWAQAARKASRTANRRVDAPEIAAVGIGRAVRAGEITWSDLATIMPAFSPFDRSKVGAMIALFLRLQGMAMPDEGGPLDYVDPRVRPAIDRFVMELDVP